MILKDLACFTCSNLNILDSMTYEIRSSMACKSVILIDLKGDYGFDKARARSQE